MNVPATDCAAAFVPTSAASIDNAAMQHRRSAHGRESPRLPVRTDRSRPLPAAVTAAATSGSPTKSAYGEVRPACPVGSGRSGAAARSRREASQGNARKRGRAIIRSTEPAHARLPRCLARASAGDRRTSRGGRDARCEGRETGAYADVREALEPLGNQADRPRSGPATAAYTESATRVPCSIARLASSSAATSAPPTSV